MYLQSSLYAPLQRLRSLQWVLAYFGSMFYRRRKLTVAMVGGCVQTLKLSNSQTPPLQYAAVSSFKSKLWIERLLACLPCDCISFFTTTFSSLSLSLALALFNSRSLSLAPARGCP